MSSITSKIVLKESRVGVHTRFLLHNTLTYNLVRVLQIRKQILEIHISLRTVQP